MRDNSYGRTIERNYIQKWRFLIAEYEEVKAGRSARFRRGGALPLPPASLQVPVRPPWNLPLSI
jgi:hypothetical protein